MTRDFVRREIIPFAAQWDRDETVPLDTVLRLGKLGLFGVCAPTEWNGAGADFLAYMLMTEELAYGDAGICNMVNAANSFGAKVRDAGTPDQKARFLRPVASGDGLGCLLMTEPHAGSDAAAMRTRAVRHGSSYVLEWSQVLHHLGTLGGICGDLRRHRPRRGQARPFGVPHAHRPARLSRGAAGDQARPSHQRHLPDRAGGSRSAGGRPAGQPATGCASPSPRWTARGSRRRRRRSAWRGRRIDAALAYARERQAFGKPILEHQAVAFRLAEMATQIEVARQMCHHVARLKTEGVRCVKEASMAKLFASEMSERVCSAAIQVHGGYGYMQDFPVEKYYRDARVFQIYDGTNEVQKILISRELAAGR